MMTREQAAKLYSELSRRTQEGELEWEQADRGDVSGYIGDKLIDAYVADYNNKWRLGLLRVATRIYDPERDVHYFVEETKLTLLSPTDSVEHEFPEAPGINDLRNSVTYTTSNAADFVTDILGISKAKPKKGG